MPARPSSSFVAFLGFISIAAVTVAQPAGKPDVSEVLPAMDRIKDLAGEWVFSDGDEKGKLAVTYEVTSGGNAVMARLFPGTEHEMVTMYHLDGEKIMLTHYCAAGNNPRMHAQPDDAMPDKLVFVFAGASNMESEEEGHMHGMTMVFVDDDHFSESWTWQEKGKDGTKTFNFERKKP